MANKERIHNALEGKPVDRMPVTVLSNQLYYQDHFKCRGFIMCAGSPITPFMTLEKSSSFAGGFRMAIFLQYIFLVTLANSILPMLLDESDCLNKGRSGMEGQR